MIGAIWLAALGPCTAVPTAIAELAKPDLLKRAGAGEMLSYGFYNPLNASGGSWLTVSAVQRLDRKSKLPTAEISMLILYISPGLVRSQFWWTWRTIERGRISQQRPLHHDN